MNTNLMQEIMKATAMINAMETEVTAAAKELETSVAQSRAEKCKRIKEFLGTMQQALMEAKYPQNQRLVVFLPWSVKERGQFTNYRWSVALRLTSRANMNALTMVFGRYFVGSREVSEDLSISCWGETRHCQRTTYGELIYPMVVDGWNEQIEAMIETKVAEAVKKTLEDRMKAMTDRLNKATAVHQKYEGE